MRDRNVLYIHQIKTDDKEMKIKRMVSPTNTPGEDYGFRLNPDFLSVIYMAADKEAQCQIVSKNRRKQDDGKKCEMIQFCKKGIMHHQKRDLW